MSAETDLWQKTFKRKDEIISRKIVGELILVPIRGKLADMQRLFALNGVAEYIWDRLDGTTSVGEIRQGVLANFDVAEDEADADIQEFITELLEADLIAGVS